MDIIDARKTASLRDTLAGVMGWFGGYRDGCFGGFVGRFEMVFLGCVRVVVLIVNGVIVIDKVFLISLEDWVIFEFIFFKFIV